MKHISYRPELIGEDISVQVTIESPQIVIVKPDGKIFKYRKGLGSGIFPSMFLQVIENQADEETDYIATAWFTPTIEDGDLLYFDPNLLRG